MRLLLDTQVVLWQLHGDRSVGPAAAAVIEESEELTFGVVAFAEIGVKAAVGKLIVPHDLHDHVLRSGLRVLGLAPDHGLGVADVLPWRVPSSRAIDVGAGRRSSNSALPR